MGRRGSGGLLVHEVDDPGQDVRVGVGQDPVPEVEHVARAGPARQPARRGPARAPRPRARKPLQGRGFPAPRAPARPGATPRPAGTRKSMPTTSAPASPMASSSSPVPTPKWIRGTPSPATAASAVAECGCTCRQVVRQRQRADPRVEQLDRAGTGLDLHPQERARDQRQPGQQLARQSPGSPYIRALVCSCPRRGPTLDQVRRERERRTGEADQRRPARARPPATGRPR